MFYLTTHSTHFIYGYINNHGSIWGHKQYMEHFNLTFEINHRKWGGVGGYAAHFLDNRKCSCLSSST